MSRLSSPCAAVLVVAALVALPTAAPPAHGQTRVTAPREALGFDIGDDYHLATYTQLEAYWARLARESRRVALQQIGTTAEGRPQLMAIVTSPENHRNLALQGNLAAPRLRRRPQRRAGARAGEGRKGGGLDRRRPARQRSPRRPAARRDGL